jgi:hypothetical protein
MQDKNLRRLENPQKLDVQRSGTSTGDETDPYFLALRDLERKRVEVDAAIEAILKLRPDLRTR